MEFMLNEFHNNVSDEDLLIDVKRIAEKLSQTTLTFKKYKESGGKFSAAAFRNHFGNWASALKLCGLNVNHHQLAMGRPNRKYTKNIITKDLLDDMGLLTKCPIIQGH